MKNTLFKAIGLVALSLLLPLISRAEGVADDLHSLQGLLNGLYNEMIPLASGMIGISRAIGGFAALWFIGVRVWKHFAAAEQIDIFPLLRPFAIGFCIAFFPLVLQLMNGILQPVVTATEGMVTRSNQAIERLLDDETKPAEEQLPAEMSTDPDRWYQYSHPQGQDSDSVNPISSAFSGWSIKNWARKFIYEVLNVLFQAAALCLDTIRTFKLIVLAILGPLCLGLSIFDGFQQSLKQWIARYVNVFMWLPVANIFGAIIAKVQLNMLLAIQSGDLGGNEFGNTSTAYLIFLLIGILGYFTVPSVSNYIMNVGGHALFNKASAMSSTAMSWLGGSVSQAFFAGNMQQHDQSKTGDTHHYQNNKLSGETAKKE